MPNRQQRTVSSPEQVAANIANYESSVARHPELAARINRHPAWYAVRDQAGRWIFGPSKFVGYQEMTATDYLATYNRKDGKETEPALARWFELVEPDTALAGQLKEAFTLFASKFGKAPNARWRVSVPREELARRRLSGSDSRIDRIDVDPLVCGGRPRIKGTRIRVSDIMGALAAGETVDEILVDFPHLDREDIHAALEYAARAVDHRVLKAA